jgi:hypothetical protein
MKNVVVDLDKEFPECGVETRRQHIEPFACCNKDRTICDQMKTCRYFRGVVHKKFVKKDTAVFVGTSGTNDGFVVVWFTLLPVGTQMKMPVKSVKNFIEQLT